MYCFILLFNLFNSSTTGFAVTGSGTLILCNVQLTMLERFSAVLPIYDVLQHNVNWKTRKYEFKKNKKSDLNQKISFFDLKNHDFFQPWWYVTGRRFVPVISC